MNIRAFTLMSFTIVLIGAGCVGSGPFSYKEKLANDPCPDGQKMTYQFTGASTVESGCKDIASDAGDVCTSSDNCINNCFTTFDYLDKIGCDYTQSECLNVQGRCEAIFGEGSVTIPRPDAIQVFYEE